MKVCKVKYSYSENLEEKPNQKAEEIELSTADYQLARQTIFCKLINTARNIGILRNVPHREFLDLSLVYYYFENNDPDASEVIISDAQAKYWKVNEAMLYVDAWVNTRSILGEIVRPLKEIIEEMLHLVQTDDPALSEDAEPMPLYVLTNHWKRNGAVCMLYEDSLKEISDLLESDILIIPSSVHEVILVPAEHGISRRELDAMVCEVNRTEVLSCEVLSEHIYVFSRAEGRLSG